jgi:hypothetical protein
MVCEACNLVLKNSVALPRKRPLPTERPPPLVGEVSADFSGYRVSRGQRNESPRPLISVFETGAATFPFKLLLSYPHEAEWTPFQTNYFTENVVAPEIEPGTSRFVARNSDH